MINLNNSAYSKTIRKPSTNHRFVFNSSNNRYSHTSNYSNIGKQEPYKLPYVSYSNIIRNINNLTITSPKKSPVDIERFSEMSPKSTERETIKRGGIIFISRKDRDIKLLVVKGNSSGIYSFPKGRQYDDETVETCATREVMEETGIRVPEDQLLNSKKCKIGKNTYFILEVNENDYNNFHINDTREISEVSWKSIDELKEINCNKDIRNVLQYPEKKYYYHNFIFAV
jgi:8-oxo-dGTP pyrophosphatase MutT (NUDIX family)